MFGRVTPVLHPGMEVRNNDKGLERKFLLPLLVRDVSVPQRCMLGRVTSVVWVLPLEKLFPVMHPGMEHGIMRKVWIEKAYWEHTRVF